MALVHTRYSQDKESQPRKRLLQKRLILRDYQDALDRPPTQYPLTPRSKWKMHYVYQNFTSECPDVWVRLPKTQNGRNYGQASKTQLVPLERNLYGTTHLQASCGKDNLRKFYWDLNGKMYRTGNVFVHRKQGLFLSVYVDDIKMAGRRQNMAPMWKKLLKNVDLEEPTSFLDHVCLGCTQRE